MNDSGSPGAPVTSRARRLAEFQAGRAPELAAAAASKAPEARSAMLSRLRQAALDRDALIGTEAARAHTAALVGEAVAMLASAAGPARCAICRSCKRALSRGRRNCPHCGQRDAPEPAPGTEAVKAALTCGSKPCPPLRTAS